MAILNKHLFGKIKGTFGTAVFRQRKGSNYIAQKPESYNPPDDEAYLNRIEKFKLASKLSSTVTANPELKSIWQTVIPKEQNPYNFFIAKFYPYLDNAVIKPSFKIVPSATVGVNLDNAAWTTDKLTLNMLPFTPASLIDINYEKTASFKGILFLSSPIDPDLPAYEVINIVSKSVNIDLDAPLSFEFLFPTNIQNINIGYQKKSIFAAMLTYNEDNQNVNYSGTIYSESSI